jgi:NAD(P)-dependent dehydrogenase (short-subunit alcohol dehydrogenase family)
VVAERQRDVQGRLAGKAALVTGAGGGIGQEIARRFAAEGARVALAGRRLATVEPTAAALPGALAIEMDVTSAVSVAAGVARVAAVFEGLDVVVNNAGVAPVGAVSELSEDDWDAVMDTNLKSAFLVTRAAWPHLAAGGGVVLSTSSICAQVAFQAHTRYCVAKAGLEMLSKCLALDGAPVGIRANCVVPGFTRTSMLEGFLAEQPDPEAASEGLTAKIPAGRLGTPRDVADAFVYLASDESAWVTGTTLVVDGGTSAGLWQPPAPAPVV